MVIPVTKPSTGKTVFSITVIVWNVTKYASYTPKTQMLIITKWSFKMKQRAHRNYKSDKIKSKQKDIFQADTNLGGDCPQLTWQSLG